MTTSTNVCGYAMYLELIHTSARGRTVQVLVTPQGMTSAHTQVPFTLYTRRLTTMTPKKQWRRSSSVTTPTGIPAVEARMSQTRIMRDYMTSLANNDWRLYKEPIIVEITPEDLEDVRLAKTPYKILGRVWKTRKFLGFPAEFIQDKTWTELAEAGI